MAKWSFDNSHSSIAFTARHLMITKVRGQFDKWTGTFEYDENDPTRSSVEVHIDAASVDTREEKRDAHLRSPDFLDVEKYPELVFKSTSVEGSGDDLTLKGDLTIHGVTRPVQLKVEALGRTKDPWGGERVAFSAATAINRKDFGLQWNVALEAGGVLVSEKVELHIELQAIRQAATQAA